MWRWIAVSVALVAAVVAFETNGSQQVHGCAFSTTPTTYEGPQNRSGYLLGLELAGYNQISPNNPAFSIAPEERGTRANRTYALAAYVPPKLLKAIAFMESNLWNAANTVPYQGIGPALVSFDCGHGVMQVTSGMTHPLDAGWPSHQQSLIATHYLFNIARGANILVSKWNASPEVRPVAGNGDPRIVESWYYALWSYNGFAFQNHPYLPNPEAWPRTGYSCSTTLNDGFSHSRTGYPYQELVLGCAARPPSVDGQPLWIPQRVNLPNLASAAYSGLTSVQAWQACAGSSNCAAMDIPLPWINNRDNTRSLQLGAGAYIISNPRLAVSRHFIDGASGQVQVSNIGGGILPWRAKSVTSWVRVNRQAGVALPPLVTCTSPCDRSPMVTITAAPNAPPGAWGAVFITNLISGNSQWILVRAPSGTPQPAASPTP